MQPMYEHTSCKDSLSDVNDQARYTTLCCDRQETEVWLKWDLEAEHDEHNHRGGERRIEILANKYAIEHTVEHQTLAGHQKSARMAKAVAAAHSTSLPTAC